MRRPRTEGRTRRRRLLAITVMAILLGGLLMPIVAGADPVEETSPVLGFLGQSDLTTSVKLVLFFDMGNTYVAEQGWDFSLWRRTTGLEMRIFLPIFQAPIRFIYGYNLNPYPDEKDSDFQFSIGTTF